MSADDNEELFANEVGNKEKGIPFELDFENDETQIDVLDAFDEEVHDEIDTLNFIPFDSDLFRKITSVRADTVVVSESGNRRQQTYRVRLSQSYRVTRSTAIPLDVADLPFICLRLSDVEGNNLTCAVNPAFLWKQSGLWITPGIVEWSINKEDTVFDLLFESLYEFTEYFGWTPAKLITLNLKDEAAWMETLSVRSETHEEILLVSAERPVLDKAEDLIRRQNYDYKKGCLWLGGQISFKSDVYIELAQKDFTFGEIGDISIGDLLAIRQRFENDEQVYVAANVKCKSSNHRVWTRHVFLKFGKEDVHMEFDDDEWKVETKERSGHEVNGDDLSEFHVGESGPDAVELDIHAGSTIISFNELCNIQEGSLIEISQNFLPMVKINVAGETLLEGELVWLDKQLMVQVTKKIG